MTASHSASASYTIELVEATIHANDGRYKAGRRALRTELRIVARLTLANGADHVIVLAYPDPSNAAARLAEIRAAHGLA